MSILGDLVKTEIRTHPNLVAIIFLVSAGLSGYAIKTFAEKTEVDTQFESVNKRIDDLEFKVDKRHYEAQIHSVESEIYQLERLERSGEADATDLKHLDSYRSELGTLKRELEDLD